MLKLIGSILIFGASTGTGLFYASEYQRQLENMIYIQQIIYMIKGEMEYTKAPLGELFGRVAVRIKEPFRSWLLRVQWEIEKRGSNTFAEIWEMCIEEELSELHLKKEYKQLLLEIGSGFGQLDTKSGVGALNLVLNRMESMIHRSREAVDNKKKLSSCIGIMGGLFLVIILI